MVYYAHLFLRGSVDPRVFYSKRKQSNRETKRDSQSEGQRSVVDVRESVRRSGDLAERKQSAAGVFNENGSVSNV